jgi:outer membrane protein
MFGRELGRGVDRSAKRIALALYASTAMVVALGAAGPANAETVGGALVKAYLNNPSLNAQRAAVRAADEGLPKAQAPKLPTVTGNAQAGFNANRINTPFTGFSPNNYADVSTPRSYGLTVTQTLYDGNRTNNTITETESSIFSAREQLRSAEQQVLLSALTSYMDVLRDTAILDLNRSNVQVLVEQLRQTRDRFNVGELTRTDVAQAESSLATAQAQELGAETQLANSIAEYRFYVGDEPKNLQPVAPLGKQLPKSISEAVSISQTEHPAIVGQLHAVDAAQMAIRVAEGALLPTVGVQGAVSQQWDPLGYSASGIRLLQGSLTGTLSVPIFDGGTSYANIRAAKETLGQQELAADNDRDQVRAQVVAAWGANLNSVGVIKADKAAVDAAEVALVGVREEAKVGQRTTLDVLNAQQAVLQARTQLVKDEHDQVVNSYTLLSAVGRLSPHGLGLAVLEYDPRTHFDQVKSKAFGGDTPEGR